MKKGLITFTLISAVIVALFGGYIYLYISKDAPVKEESDRNDGLGSLFPFGDRSASVPQGVTSSTTVELTKSEVSPIPDLRQLSLVPIAGATSFRNGSSTAIRYMERGTGHIYEAYGESLTQIRISNKTIPKVYEAVWGNNGNSVLMRFLDEEDNIRTFSGELVSPKTGLIDPSQKNLEGLFLPSNIREIAISPKQNRMFYLSSDQSEAVGLLSPLRGERPSAILATSFREWSAAWPKENIIALTAKPSGLHPGLMYFLNPETKEITRVLDRIAGLTAIVSADGGNLLYGNSDTRNGSTRLYLYKIKDGSRSELLIKTLPEKCVWSLKDPAIAYCAAPRVLESAVYPDAWYQGKVSFIDTIWRFDSDTETLTRLADLQALTNQEIDATHLKLSPDDKYLLFTNKNDLTLWVLKI